jgi:L-lysine exporter family protein LysE/ArgO
MVSILVIGGKVLSPWFRSDKSWQKLDMLVGVTMWIIGLVLLKSTF